MDVEERGVLSIMIDPTSYPELGVIVYVCDDPSVTTVEPLGATVPFGFWFAMIVKEPDGGGIRANVAEIV